MDGTRITSCLGSPVDPRSPRKGGWREERGPHSRVTRGSVLTTLGNLSVNKTKIRRVVPGCLPIRGYWCRGPTLHPQPVSRVTLGQGQHGDSPTCHRNVVTGGLDALLPCVSTHPPVVRVSKSESSLSPVGLETHGAPRTPSSSCYSWGPFGVTSPPVRHPRRDTVHGGRGNSS